jgi:hypothetical protein
MDLNASTILGFRYSHETETTLTPSKASRTVAILQFKEGSYHWIRIPEPPHDSNKLYSCFKGLPSSSWIDLDVEDVGLEQHALQVQGTPCTQVTWMDLIGAGWMTTESMAGPMMLVCGSVASQWSVYKFSTPPTLSQIPLLVEKQWDLIVPLVQPQRVSTEQGVYFVG